MFGLLVGWMRAPDFWAGLLIGLLLAGLFFHRRLRRERAQFEIERKVFMDELTEARLTNRPLSVGPKRPPPPKPKPAAPAKEGEG